MCPEDSQYGGGEFSGIFQQATPAAPAATALRAGGGPRLTTAGPRAPRVLSPRRAGSPPSFGKTLGSGAQYMPLLWSGRADLLSSYGTERDRFVRLKPNRH